MKLLNFNRIRQHKITVQRLFPAVFLLWLSLLTCQVSAETLSGYISLVGKQASKVKLEDVIVYFEPEMPVTVTPLSSPLVIKMKNKAYHPRISTIPAGSEIVISNHDKILHNAFSPSRSNIFDLGFYGKNEQRLHKLDRSGIVRIFCNVHYHMVAYVLVLDTPFFTQVEDKGFFELDNIPSGKGKLIIWHERASKISRKITLPYSNSLSIKLPITKRRIPEHKKKSGKNYKKKRRRRKY